MTTRRELLALLAGAAAPVLVQPRAARAQQGGGVRRLGVLMAFPEEDSEGQAFVVAFRDGLRKLGWVEGRNLRVDYRWAGLDTEITRRFAEELVALQPELIFSSSTFTTAALLQLTRTIPIVFGNVIDPIGSGFAASMARPGGNVTGFINLDPTMVGKWLELLKEIAPRVTRVAALYEPVTAPYADIYLEPFKAGAQSLGLGASVSSVHDMAGVESVCAELGRQPNGGVILVPCPFMLAHRAEVASLAARYRLPAVYFNRAFTQVGGLASYGNDLVDNYRRAAAYVDRVLRGEKPSGLPIQFPEKFELVINLKCAKALGLDVPSFLQQRADEVIE